MRRLISVLVLLLSFNVAPGAAQPPSPSEQTATWAASLGHGAVATAVKLNGRWTFALGGQPFAAGHAEVPAERVLFEIGSITKVFTGILLADAVKAGKLSLDDTLAQRLPVKFNYPATGAVTLKQLATGSQPVTRTEVALPAATLDEYVGVYPIDKSARFTLLRRGDGLVARLTGQPFFPVFASAKDEFFYKVVDARLSFRRDASGKIAGLTLHQNGRDIPATRDASPPPHVEFPNAAALAEYAGEYDFGQYQTGATITVKATPEVLMVTLTGQPAFPVFAVGKDRFEYDVVVAALTFERDAAGKVTAVVLHQNGLDMRAPRR